MYILMNKDSEVAEFDRSKDQLDGRFTIVSAEKEKLPIGFQDINIWLDKRQAAKHREHLRLLMAQCNCLNSEGFIKITHAASLNDTFWVKSSEEDVVWDTVSLYKNEFNEVISKISFEGNGLFGIDFSTTTPEFSTEGSFEKSWKRENNKAVLTPEIKRELINLQGFKFTYFDSDKFPRQRLTEIEKIINRQISGILDKNKMYTVDAFPEVII